MTDILRRPGARYYFSDLEEYRPLMPTDNAKPCWACGSPNRTYNTAGDCFCRRCGRKDETVRVSTFTTLR